MARPSSTERPYLSLRPDTGHYVYLRELGPDIAVLIVGNIARPWSTQPYQVTGGSIIKVSLKTSDLAIAQDRWLEVHNQVEERIKRARKLLNAARVREAGRNEPEMRVELSADELAVLAEQMRHDILSDRDQRWKDRQHLSPTARATWLASRRKLSTQEARKRGLEVDNGAYGAAVAEYCTGLMETTTHEVVDGPAARSILDRLAQSRGLLDHLVGLDDSRPEADPADMAALSAMSENRIQHGELDRRLAENGVTLPAGSPARIAAARELIMAAAQAHDDVAQQSKGKAISTPARPGPIMPGGDVTGGAAAERSNPLLSEMYEVWASNKDLDGKTRQHTKLYVRRFIDMHGDLPVASITPEHVIEYRDTIARFPRNVPGSMINRSPRDIADWADKQGPGLRRIKPQTVNTRALGAISTVLHTARRKKKMLHDPCCDLALRVEKTDVKVVLPFEVSQLNQLFSSPELTRIRPDDKACGGAAAFWIPRIALFTGCRLEEIAQLQRGDIKRQFGIDFIHITTKMVEPDPHGKNKQLKTDSAHRMVPIHPVLIEAGFLDYVAECRRSDNPRLFPLVDSEGPRRAKNFSRWFGRLIDRRLPKAGEELNFHSFRHTFMDGVLNGCDDELLKDALVGHARKGTGRKYGMGYWLKTLNGAVRSVEFEGLVLPPVTWLPRKKPA